MKQLDPERLKGCPKDCPDRCADPNCHDTCPENLERIRRNAEIRQQRQKSIEYDSFKISRAIETQRKIKGRIRLKYPK